MAESALPAPTSLTPFLLVERGKAQEAVEWYKSALGFVQMELDLDPKASEDGKPLLMHAHLKNGAAEIRLADAPASHYPPGQTPMEQKITCYFMLFTSEVDKLVSKAEKAGAKVTMAPHDAFWGARYAEFMDPFGFGWSAHHQLCKESAQT
eukprot:SM000067S20366  [mRNA]  locus=s67:490470:491187:- [translate_table: standard]